MTATALAEIWLWQTAPSPRIRGRLTAIAMLSVAIALMSQSIGAILLLVPGVALLWAFGRLRRAAQFIRFKPGDFGWGAWHPLTASGCDLLFPETERQRCGDFSEIRYPAGV